MTPLRIGTLAGIAAVTLVAIWVSVMFTVAMITARSDPQTALTRWPVDIAKAETATAILGKQPSRTRAKAAERLALEVLERMPVNAEAARDVAMARLVEGDVAGARMLIAAGERLSRRDIPTQMWMIEDRVAAGDVPATLAHYDRALRISPESRPVLLPVLAQAANDPVVARALAARLRVRPEWWSDFFGRFVAVATDPLAIRLIAEGLHLDPTEEVDRARVVQVIGRLVQLGDYRAARSFYDRTTGRRPEMVVDGGFEKDHGIPPFDWQLVDETDRSATREPRDRANGTALSIAGTEGKEVARQLLVLPPGRYRLTARTGAVTTNMMAPPTVSITCLQDQGTLVASTAFPVGMGPKTLAMAVTIPAGCNGQWLTIGSAANVGYLSDNPWIDDVRIVTAGLPFSPLAH